MSDSASSPEHASTSEVGYQTTNSHFRPNMQSPPYQGSVVSGINYSDRPYENQMGSHYQSNSYSSYQPPPSPYRPHPVSPPTHHYNSSVSQMHSYPGSHQMAPYSASQSHYGQDLFPSRGSLYPATGSAHNMQPLKSSWSDASNGEMLQSYSQPTARQSLLSSPSPMPMPPPLRSPPHSSLSVTPVHYRQMPMSSSPTQSPHSWPSQSQIPSPGVLQSPRATPSPLPNHSRSPGHVPFSPPPTAPSSTPSPHHPPPTTTPHPQIPKTAPSSPTLSSPASQVAGSADPLQSLQKMVMLDSAEARTNYDMQTGHTPVPAGGRPATYFSSVENLAGNDPGSPYPTYYNLDQNRLCTPPRTTGSTPTSSSFISAPDSTSNSSVSGDSYATQETGLVGQANGELSEHHTSNQQDCASRCITDCTIPNGGGPPGHQIMRNMSCDQDQNSHDLMPMYDSCYVSNSPKKNLKPVRARRRSTPADFGVNEIDAEMQDRMFLTPPLRKCMPAGSPQDEGLINGQLECFRDDGIIRKRARGMRVLNSAARWNRGMGTEGSVVEDANCMVDNGVFLSLTSKRVPRKRRSVSCPTGGGDVSEISEDLTVESCVSRSPRGGRGRSPRSGGRRSRRRVGSSGPYFGDRMMDNPYGDMHPIDGMGDMTNVGKRDDDGWDGPSLHVGASPTTDECIYREHDSSSIMGAPMMETPGNPVLPSQPVSPRRTIVDYSRTPGGVVAGIEPPTQQPPVERKRGRPRGSKNKPKLPGEETKPKKGKKRVVEVATAATAFGCEQHLLLQQHQQQQHHHHHQQQQQQLQYLKTKKGRTLTGPYIHVTGTKEKPFAIEVVNAIAPKEEEKDLKCIKQKRQQQLGTSLRKKLGVGHTSTLSPYYDAVTRDKSWVCALCCKGSHHKGLGDLFGPYYTREDQKPSDLATSSSGVPTPMSITTDDGDHGSPLGSRKVVRTKRRNSAVEEFVRTNHLKKRKQGKKSSFSDLATATPETEHSPTAASCSSTAATTVPAFAETEIGGCQEFWVHEDCAVWSHGVFLVRHHIRGLEEAVREAANMICSRCKLGGAMVGCLNRGCAEQYHVICAREKGCEMNEDNFSLFCPKHKVPENQHSIDNKFQWDKSRPIGKLIRKHHRKYRNLVLQKSKTEEDC